jgi:hypothetical protein
LAILAPFFAVLAPFSPEFSLFSPVLMEMPESPMPTAVALERKKNDQIRWFLG